MHIESRKFIASAFQFVGYALWAPLFTSIFRHFVNHEEFTIYELALFVLSFPFGLMFLYIGWYIIYVEEKKDA